MESYNPFSMAVKINCFPPSISALVLISFQNICIQQQLREGGSVEGQLGVFSAFLPKPPYIRSVSCGGNAEHKFRRTTETH